MNHGADKRAAHGSLAYNRGSPLQALCDIPPETPDTCHMRLHSHMYRVRRVIEEGHSLFGVGVGAELVDSTRGGDRHAKTNGTTAAIDRGPVAR